MLTTKEIDEKLDSQLKRFKDFGLEYCPICGYNPLVIKKVIKSLIKQIGEEIIGENISATISGNGEDITINGIIVAENNLRFKQREHLKNLLGNTGGKG